MMTPGYFPAAWVRDSITVELFSHLRNLAE
jgi:hypothetical protein